MNSELFNLRSLRSPRLDDGGLKQSILGLSKLTEGMLNSQTESLKDVFKDFRERMRDGLLKGESFEDCTKGRRREWILLSLYLNDLGADESRSWLPPMDKNIAISILGKNSVMMKTHLRRLATQLYFTHYDTERLPCLDFLASMLVSAWSTKSNKNIDPASLAWAEHAHTLFSSNAPEKVADRWTPGMTVHQLADSFHIHPGGLFREKLLLAIILNRLWKLPITNNDSELNELVIAERHRKLKSGLCLGAAAVQVLVNRSQKENLSVVPTEWREQIVMYACDPRIPNTEMQSRWWGWANNTEKDVAIRAIGELNMLQFIRLLEESLEGSELQHQFPARKRMLLKLFELGKVQDVRLVVTRRLYGQMDMKTRGNLLLNWVNAGSRGKGNADTSFICIKCVDDVYLIEATGSFGLRGFIGSDSFPIENFWNSQPKSYYDHQLRVNQYSCPIYQVHHKNWVRDFVSKLRTYNIEWRGLS